MRILKLHFELCLSGSGPNYLGKGSNLQLVCRDWSAVEGAKMMLRMNDFIPVKCKLTKGT